MADEEKKNTLTGQDGETEVPVTPDYKPGEGEQYLEHAAEDGPLTEADRATADVLEATEQAAESSPVIRIFDETVTAVQEAVDQIEGVREDPHADTFGHHAEYLSDTTTVFGREVTLPGGIYTVVFIALAIATVIEFVLFELPRGPLTIPLMLAFGAIKAVLVVMFDMHLRTDSRIFSATLLVPVAIALVATFFLMTVPIA